MNFSTVTRLVAGVGVWLMVAACSSGGGGSDDPAGQTPVNAGAATGQIVVIAGDDDINDWDSAIFTISRVVLLGGSDGQVVIVDEPMEIDFLALDEINEVLAYAEVPADTYEKIRFEVDSIVLRTYDDREDRLSIDLEEDVALSSGKVDINPQGSFTVGDGQQVVIEVDVDLDESIKVHETGNGKWKFRPVIFANVLTIGGTGPLVRTFGGDINVANMQALQDGTGGFELCGVVSLAEIDPQQNDDCVNVVLNADTSIFAVVTDDEMTDHLMPVGRDAIIEDGSAVVYGFVKPAASAVTDGEPVVTIDAQVIALGRMTENPYAIVECEAEAAPSAASIDDPLSFPCEIEDEDSDVVDAVEDDDEEIVVVLVEGSKLFRRDGSSANSEDIGDDVEVEAEGLWLPGQLAPEAVPGQLEAFVAIIADDAEDEVEGMLLAIDLPNRQLTVLDEDDGVTELCVAYDDDTMFYSVVEDSTADSVEGGIVTVAALAEGIELEAEGVFVDGCLQATEIILESDGEDSDEV